MKLDKRALSLYKIAQDAHEPEWQAVALEGNQALATDGHLLGIVTLAGDPSRGVLLTPERAKDLAGGLKLTRKALQEGHNLVESHDLTLDRGEVLSAKDRASWGIWAQGVPALTFAFDFALLQKAVEILFADTTDKRKPLEIQVFKAEQGYHLALRARGREDATVYVAGIKAS